VASEIRKISCVIVLSVLFWTLPTILQAGPPFLTDDPEPVGYQQGELNLFSTETHTRGGHTVLAPAMEYNYGGWINTQLHVGLSVVHNIPDHEPSVFGFGDIELGVKYRFIQESDISPQIAFYPLINLPTGDTSKGLGNGTIAYTLPLWIQKSWDEWTTYGGVGYAINPAPGQNNYLFAGWLLQRNMDVHWTLGLELYTRGKTTPDSDPITFLNVGGTYKFTSDCNVLFSIGHSISGEDTTVAYLGLGFEFLGQGRR
jgi:hypothetical protein